MGKPKVLVVVDQEEPLNSHKTRLESYNYEVHVARNVEEALESCRQSRFPVVVTDLSSGRNGDGLRAARKIREISAETQVVILTNEDTHEQSPDAYRVNVFAFPSQKELPNTIASVFDELQKNEVRKQMLSFLTHTMVNTFAGAIPALDHTLHLGKSLTASHMEDDEIFSTINNLGFIRTALSTVDSMLKSFKLLIRKPENLRAAWNNDSGNDTDIDQVLESAITAVLHRLMFQDMLFPSLELLSARHGLDPDQVQNRFMAEMLLGDPSEKPATRDWISNRLPFLRVSGRAPNVLLKRDGIRSNILFSVFTELILNAIKYTDGERHLALQWTIDEDKYALTVSNSFQENRRQKGGSKEGHNFINALLRPLDGLSVGFREKRLDEGSSESLQPLVEPAIRQQPADIFESTFVISKSALTTGE